MNDRAGEHVLCYRHIINCNKQCKLFFHQHCPSAMAFCPSICKILRRGKYCLLLLLSLSVLAWFATFSGNTFKSIQFSSVTPRTIIKEDSLREKLASTSATKDLKTLPPKPDCPEESPLLRKFTAVCFSYSPTLLIPSYIFVNIESVSIQVQFLQLIVFCCWQSSTSFNSSV